jgi:hypothetical protein
MGDWTPLKTLKVRVPLWRTILKTLNAPPLQSTVYTVVPPRQPLSSVTGRPTAHRRGVGGGQLRAAQETVENPRMSRPPGLRQFRPSPFRHAWSVAPRLRPRFALVIFRKLTATWHTRVFQQSPSPRPGHREWCPIFHSVRPPNRTSASLQLEPTRSGFRLSFGPSSIPRQNDRKTCRKTESESPIRTPQFLGEPHIGAKLPGRN